MSSTRTVKAVALRFFRNATKFSMRLYTFLFHSSRSAIAMSVTANQSLVLAEIRRLSMSGIFSIGLACWSPSYNVLFPFEVFFSRNRAVYLDSLPLCRQSFISDNMQVRTSTMLIPIPSIHLILSDLLLFCELFSLHIRKHTLSHTRLNRE